MKVKELFAEEKYDTVFKILDGTNPTRPYTQDKTGVSTKNFVQTNIYKPKIGLTEAQPVKDYQIETLTWLDQEMPKVIMLKDGYFLEKYSDGSKTVIRYSLKRLMEDDDIFGMLYIMKLLSSPGTSHKFMWQLCVPGGNPIAIEYVTINQDDFTSAIALTKNFAMMNIYNPKMGLTEAHQNAHSELYNWVEKHLHRFVKDDKEHHAITEGVHILPDGTVMLSRGFYLEPHPILRDIYDHKKFRVTQLINEDKTFAEVQIMKGADPKIKEDYYFFYIEWVDKTHPTTHKIHFANKSSYEKILYVFYEWVDMALARVIRDEDTFRLKNARPRLGEGLFADLRKARQDKNNDAKPVYMRRLNKDGSESGMRDATTFYYTEKEAKAHHDELVKNNPHQRIAHHLYSYDGNETFKTRLIGGKIVPFKGRY